MRKIIIITTMIMLFITKSSVVAQSYYYCNGNKVTLSLEANRYSILSIKSNQVAVNYNGATIVKTLQDSLMDVRVVSMTATTANRMKTSLLGGYIIENCYVNNSGLELAPTGYINIKLKKRTDYRLLKNIAATHNLSIVRQNKFMPLWYSLCIGSKTSTSVIDIANTIFESGLVDSCSPDFYYEAMEISYDPDIVNQWGLYNNEYEGMDISISNAWCYSSGKGVRIAIVDQGVDVNHIDLAKNIYMSYDCSTRTSPTASYGNHGTHCAGIVAAVRNNGIQITGVAPDAKLMAAGVDFGQPNASTSLADGINWAWENGADIISCSWKSPDLDIIRNALDNAIDKGRNGRGCVVVKSAGNSSSEITFPGSYRKEVIAVANLTKSGVRSNSSCFGENLLVAAPGTNILSTINGDKIGYMSGTSMACPHVSGIAALILERNEDLSVLEVREILAKSTKKVGDKPYDTNKEFGTWNKWYGYGMIDACKAVLNTKRK